MKELSKPRYSLLDLLRGVTLVSMIAYHACWNLDYVFYVIDFPYEGIIRFWQQSICWTFLLLSGFCWSMSRQKLKRGLLTLGGAALVSMVTYLAMPQNAISFGVLSLIGSAMLILIPLEGMLVKIPSLWGIAASFFLFLLTRSVSSRAIGLWGTTFFRLPNALYANYLTAYLGFPPQNFFSGDYFPLFPWLFLYLTGYFLYRFFVKKDLLARLPNVSLPLFNLLGKHSLVVYLLHQPLLYGIMKLLFS